MNPLIKSQKEDVAIKGLTIDHTHQSTQNSADGAFDPELSALIEVWPDLPESIRAGIAAMVATVRG